MKTILEVLKLEDGQLVDAVQGRLTVTGPRVEKTREDCTHYTAQTFTLTDATGMIAGTIYDHYELEPYNGQTMVLCSQKSRNHRYGGCTVVKVEAPGSLFTRRPPKSALRVSKAGGIHTPETYRMTQPK